MTRSKQHDRHCLDLSVDEMTQLLRLTSLDDFHDSTSWQAQFPSIST